MRTLITGGGGFIGSHLVDRLLAEGHEVRVLDNFATGRRENLTHVRDSIELLEGDIQSYERAHNAVSGCEVVFHEAALPSVPRSVADPLTSNATNVIGTLNVLLAARDSGVRRVVFASSSSVYGANNELPKHEELVPLPISPYAVTKLTGEGYCRSFAAVYGMETVALRYFNIFGPRQDPLSQYSGVVPKFINALLAGEQPTIHGDGEQSRDFTFVENAVDANILAMSAAPADAMRTFNVASGARTTLNELFAQLASLADSDVEPIYGPARAGDVRHSLADVSLAEARIGYTPQVGLREGLARTFESYQARSAAPQRI